MCQRGGHLSVTVADISALIELNPSMWIKNAMVAAIEAVRNKQLSHGAACKTVGIPRCTLQIRLCGKTEQHLVIRH